jgi:hypothetical protein
MLSGFNPTDWMAQILERNEYLTIVLGAVGQELNPGATQRQIIVFLQLQN